ncbi:MAG: M24 family metallopeptidase [Christensenellales bacterium]|jgi:Xaa-Pro aminopeptidase
MKAGELASRRPRATASLISKPENIRYLSGFTGEGVLLLENGGKDHTFQVIITDFRYTEQARQQSPGLEIYETSAGKRQNEIVQEVLKDAGLDKLYIEADAITLSEYEELKSALSGVDLLKGGAEVEELRAIKSADEVENIRMAESLTDEAFSYLLTAVKPGVTEMSLVALLYKFFLDNGAEDFSFSPIVASGENSSKPHAISGQRQIKQGDLITFDFGCKINGYCSDFTRTIAVGGIDPELEKIYNIVLEANLKGLAAVKAGTMCKDVDAAAREHIASCGYGRNFGHSTGHGVGLEIHEAPRLSAASEQVLKSGMIVTVEPGIYLPGKGGVRIEDLVLVTEEGCEILSKSTKQLITL